MAKLRGDAVVEPMIWTYLTTPIGELLLARNDEGIATIAFEGAAGPVAPQKEWRRDDGAFDDVRRQLAAYFGRELQQFDLPLAPHGTPFQLDVWSALKEIPYGETRSYAQLAASIGRPAAVRAVGAANGANPLPIVVPCHRVIGANGSLTGFGGGLHAKRFLLDLETYC